MTYRDYWTIEPLYMNEFAYVGTHRDYDGAPSYGDEPPADRRCFTGPTVEDVQQQIDAYEDSE